MEGICEALTDEFKELHHIHLKNQLQKQTQTATTHRPTEDACTSGKMHHCNNVYSSNEFYYSTPLSTVPRNVQ